MGVQSSAGRSCCVVAVLEAHVVHALVQVRAPGANARSEVHVQARASGAVARAGVTV